MSIQAFIQHEVLLPRLKRNGVLVVYDPEQRYRGLCLNLVSDTLRVVDTTESSIESRPTLRSRGSWCMCRPRHR
jgi:hypothetical protein